MAVHNAASALDSPLYILQIEPDDFIFRLEVVATELETVMMIWLF